MTDKHFELDVDPEGLRSTAQRVGELVGQLQRQGERAAGAPGDIGERWTGSAATDIKTEMTALGRLLGQFSRGLEPVPGALRTLAGHYEDALDQLPSLNRRWDEAEQAYQDAVAGADRTLRDSREQLTSDGRRTNRFEMDELQRIRDGAVSGAASDKAATQRGLEMEFGYLKQSLRMHTGTLSEALQESTPVDVPADAVTRWRNGQAPDVDTSSLLGSLLLANQLQMQRQEEALRRQHEEAREDAREKLQDLQDALEDGDPEAINEALEEIGRHADDPIWSEEMVRELGPQGMQDIYLQIDQGLSDGTLYIDEVWPALEAFTATAAQGVSALDHESFGEYLEEWMQEDYGAKMWALLASADEADGRINAAALANHSEIYNAALNQIGTMPGLFPQVFHYAYPDTDQMEQWASRSSGSDLADIVEHLSPEYLEDLLFRMHNVQTDGGTMNEDDYQLVADLYGEALIELKERFLDRLENEGAGEEPEALLRMLEWRNANVGVGGGQYADALRGYVDSVASDPRFVDWYLNHLGDQVGGIDISRSNYRDLLRDGNVDVEQVISDVLDYQLDRGDDPAAVAAQLGDLLRAQDLLGNEMNWNDVVKSLADGALGFLDIPPGISALKGVLESIYGAYGEMEAIDGDSDDDERQAKAQKAMVFALYVRAHGQAPPGFEDFVERENLHGDEDAPIEYYEWLRRQDNQTYRELQDMYDAINGSRDDAL